jgi:phosphomannomutase / phosphoglucomutase
MTSTGMTLLSHIEESGSPWKSCDLRGIYPEPISIELLRDVGAAIGTMLSSEARVFVAGDFRLSTLVLKQGLIEGLVGTGLSAVDGGRMPTPVAYFIGEQMGADAVLIVTASHNPANHNGLKLMIGGVPTTPEQLSDIQALVESRSFRSGVGTSETIDLVALYERKMIERWHRLEPQHLPSIVIDAGNGAWSEIAPHLLRTLGFNVRCLSCVADGNFPDRPSDCSRTENLSRLRAAVTSVPNTVGIAWDGDGDRVAFIDEAGSHASTDEVSLLLARDALQNGTGNHRRIVVDLKLSDVVRREILAQGGIPLLERTGHAFVRGRMLADEAILGLDACGHYFHKELYGGDDGLFTALLMLDILQRSGQSLFELRRTLPNIFCTPELRIPIGLLSFGDAAGSLQAALPAAEISRIDGLRFVLEKGIVLIRASGTEPMISLRIEGVDDLGLRSLIEQCMEALPTAKEFLRDQLAPHLNSNGS